MKDTIIKILRWIAVPLVYLTVSILGYLLGKIIFNYIFADTGLFLFNNPKVQSAIADVVSLASQAFGVGLAMLCAGMTAPSHNIRIARIIGVIHAAVILLCLILVLLTNNINLSEIAGALGVLLGVILGWKIIEETMS